MLNYLNLALQWRTDFFFFLSVGFDIVKYQCLIKPTKTT